MNLTRIVLAASLILAPMAVFAQVPSNATINDRVRRDSRGNIFLMNRTPRGEQE